MLLCKCQCRQHNLLPICFCCLPPVRCGIHMALHLLTKYNPPTQTSSFGISWKIVLHFSPANQACWTGHHGEVFSIIVFSFGINSCYSGSSDKNSIWKEKVWWNIHQKVTGEAGIRWQTTAVCSKAWSLPEQDLSWKARGPSLFPVLEGAMEQIWRLGLVQWQELLQGALHGSYQLWHSTRV